MYGYILTHSRRRPGERLSSVFSPDGTLISASAAPPLRVRHCYKPTCVLHLLRKNIPESQLRTVVWNSDFGHFGILSVSRSTQRDTSTGKAVLFIAHTKSTEIYPMGKLPIIFGLRKLPNSTCLTGVGKLPKLKMPNSFNKQNKTKNKEREREESLVFLGQQAVIRRLVGSRFVTAHPESDEIYHV